MLSAPEALYFNNEPVAHIVAHQDVKRWADAWSRSWDAAAARLHADHQAYRARLAQTRLNMEARHG